MSTLRIGTPDHLAARPLVYGLTQHPDERVQLVYDEPGRLADLLDRKRLDAALVPSIEFLRGIGAYHLAGPALIARGRTRSLILASRKSLPEVEKIAVGEYCRTPLVALRRVLDRLYGALPDFCVLKDTNADWRTQYDAILLAGDRGLEYSRRQPQEDETLHDLGEMWSLMTPTPLVLSLWAYNDESLRPELESILRGSRDHAVKNLSLLSDGVATTTPYDGEFLYKFFTSGWSYNLGPQEEEGLRVLEEFALEYRLIHERRLDKVVAG